MKTQYVKITKAVSTEWWYYGLIGTIYPVLEVRDSGNYQNNILARLKQMEQERMGGVE